MKMKFEATLKRTEAQPGAPPWHARKIAVPVLGVIAATAVILGLTASTVILLLSTGRGTNTSPQARPAAVFLKTDTATQGNWKGVYGSAGFTLASDAANLPAYARIVLPGKSNTATWIDHTDQPRALQRFNTGDRIGAAWFNFSAFTIDVNLTGDKMHRVAFYLLDWDSTTRVENIVVADGMNGRTLDVHQASKFAGGQYLVYNMSGHVIVRVTPVAGANAVLSAVFFD